MALAEQHEEVHMQYIIRSRVHLAFCLIALGACGGGGSTTDTPCDPSLRECGGGGEGGTGSGGEGGDGGFGGVGGIAGSGGRGTGGKGGNIGGSGGSFAGCSSSSQCGQNQFCDFTRNGCGFVTFIGASDERSLAPVADPPVGVAAPQQPGICVNRTEACADIFAPVCGCDGRTYANDCERQHFGVSKASDGKCDGSVIVVGPGGACGARDGGNSLVCDKGLFCETADNQCAMSGGRGTCQKAPQVCTAISAPVCGCDGKTYDNDCVRRSAKQSLAHTGSCAPTTARLGEACGPALALTCERGLVCDPQPNQCSNAKFVGTCRTQNIKCDTNASSPVCGCDGRTYVNDCIRLASGVTKSHEGECKMATRLLESSVWGGPHAELAAKEPMAGGFLRFDCGQAQIVSPLEIDGNGSFTWKARYTFTGGPALAAPDMRPAPRDAVITGSVSGDRMKLSIQIAGSMDQPAFSLTKDSTGSFTFCL